MLALKSLLAVLPFFFGQGVAAAPAPIPSGGVGVRANDTPPVYGAMTDFDYQSFLLGLNQEWIELDLFNYGVARFSAEEFASAGLNADDVSLIQFMANQEIGHAQLLTNIIENGGHTPALQCEYKYDFDNVRDFVNFCQRLTRWGESGVYGFLAHLDARDAATLLTQSITTEARQQMTFRQFSGAHPFPVYFETGISQSMAWSLLSRYIVSCPAQNPRIEWPIFPWLSVTNEPSLLVDGYNAAITHNRTSLTEPGRKVEFSWEAPGKTVSYNNSYNTSIGGLINATQPSFVAFINQLNVTYAPLNVTGENTGFAYQPGGTVFENTNQEYQTIINGTSFVALTDTDLYVTPYNLSLLNDHIFAWGLYQAN
ncbi:Rds1 protein [Papiliotrema laurentii]|uniref:Rds1 protein n=1 Tax=Papiliotrema laurentii TaxID=5418 RepID=A0AAD9FPC0_PAPLA|nr:Rds1 protein [Papiliotrema laurentii]